MIKAYGKRIIIERFTADDKQGGILIPEGAKKHPYKGKVISVGAELTGKIGEGDIVHYSQFSGVDINGGINIVLMEDDILATESK